MHYPQQSFLRHIDAELDTALDVGVVQQVQGRLFNVGLDMEVGVYAAALGQIFVLFRIIGAEQSSRAGNKLLKLGNGVLAIGESIFVVLVHIIATPGSPFLIVPAHLKFVGPDSD